ncbi:hypothetical protein Sme01_46460 [Sphaerisporangium melleum]|uniref:Tn3 transposase DDE domain-containing protein n=1 Tax=Sphaerisporangium melleum TaxID=321316 RepID=A0A917RE16_9ACTN|nr:Tn3 family transposase [Sphaerisporangium melleum]GGL01798.1 hypothetical protein GCM10007964_49870 [Sphaerisporangium melleum]GII72170.1 hypothetical protein Sme01_46460 [Sphaerisporangium melleum]
MTGGAQTLKDLVYEFKTKGPAYRTTVQTTLRASYTNHYRRGLIALLDTLEFKSNNTAYQPVIEALELVKRYAKAGSTTYYPRGERVPEHRGTAGAWEDLVFKRDKRGRRRVVRMVYEIVTFQALREALRCKEIWVVGAGSFRDPEEDLPADFAARRVTNYAELRKPLDPAVFIAELKAEMRAELEALDTALPTLDWVEIKDRRSGAIKLTKIGPAEEPRNLRKIKNEVGRRWGSVPLIDMLKEAVLRTGCLNAVTSVAGTSSLAPEVLAERLMLAIFGYGTNTGIRAVAAGGHAHSEDDIRYVRRRYLTPQVAADIAIAIANATFTARDTALCFRRPLPAPARTPARDPGRAERGGGLQRRQLGHPLREGRRHRHQPARGTGDDRAVPAHPAGRSRLHQHPDAARRPGRPRVGQAAQARRPARPDALVLAARPALR